MKILVFNVKYSENLGDGLLALCIEKYLGHGGVDNVQIETIDLAGREGFGTSRNRRQPAIRILHRLPPFARRMAVEYVLGRSLRKLRQEWEKKIAAADAVVIGGGNLFQDDDLNFPLKVGTLLDCVRQAKRPLAIYAVGVSGHWSPRAKSLFERLHKTQIVHLSVRDNFASDNWSHHFPDGPAAEIFPDPGLLVRHMTGPQADLFEPKFKRVAGICVTEPIILERHASQSVSAIPFRSVDDYRELIKLLLADGHRVCVFCNGAAEDQAFANQILDDAAMAKHLASGRVELAERPRTPEELIDILTSTSVILAHRLHACIAAYSLAIPHVGLGWDKKVQGFFQSVGREEYFVNGTDACVRNVWLQLNAAEREGIDAQRHAAVLEFAQSGLSHLRQALECTVRNNFTTSPKIYRKGITTSSDVVNHGVLSSRKWI
ncbi:polysaccharide pyruvyl transferase family protein [Rhizobium tubonense]|uniref:polysaccharide pyruvyl transferase family protein n=1 Tax=Rhizobium tubonense TaxID=484088 RepID=UPI0018A7F069|nr:polysaccharide pyruvyl transferase family protein [Rhizobium tubonense]